MRSKLARKATSACDVIFSSTGWRVSSCCCSRSWVLPSPHLSLLSPHSAGRVKEQQILRLASTKSSSSSGPSLYDQAEKQRLIADALDAARRLDSYTIYRNGTFGPTEYAEAKRVLDIFINEKVNSLDGIDASIRVLSRVVRELAISKMSEVDQKDASSWACEPVYYNPLLENWRTVTPNRVHSGIILPRMLLRKLFELSRFNPNFRFNLDTLEIIMDGAIKQARPRRGPIRVEGLVDDILLEATVSYRDIQPYIRIWNKLMDAWSKNNMNFAPKRMWLLLRTMRNKGLQPNTDTYATFLSYWNRRGRPSEMHQICDEMMRENIPMNAKCLSYLFNVHLKCGKTEDAEDVLWQMLDLKPQGDDHCQAIRKCAFKLFHVYKNSRLLDSSNEETASVSLKAENAFRHVENWVALNDRDKTIIIASLMNLLASDLKRERAIPYLDKIPLENPDICRLLINAYGDKGQGDLAMSMYKSTLRRSQPNLIERFNTIIEAWTDSTKRNAVTQAFRTYRLLQEDPQCKILGVQPNFRTYFILLKSLAVNSSRFTANRAANLIHEMERRYENGEEDMKQTTETLTFALRSCLLEDDIVNAKIFVEKLSKLDSSIDVLTITEEILDQWEKKSALQAYEREMVQLNDSARVDANARLYHNMLLAWARMLEPTKEERIWQLFEKLRVDGVYPSRSTFSAVFSFLGRQESREYMEKAEFLLCYMENSKLPEMIPSYKYYKYIVKGWVGVLDNQRAHHIVERNIHSFMSGNRLAALRPGVFRLLFSSFRRCGQLVDATNFIIAMHEMNSSSKEFPKWPNEAEYKNLLDDWKSSTMAEKATELLKLKHHLERLNLNHLCESVQIYDDAEIVEEERASASIENV